MSESILSSPHFQNEEAAFDFVESRLWPNGPVCPHCGCVEHIGKLKGKTTRIGLYKCYNCYKPFTVKMGSIFEDSKVPLRLWLQAMYLMCASKKGCSSNQLHRTLGVTLKTAWFMSHRIREAMREGEFAPFGSGGGIVEADETFIGKDPDIPQRRGGYAHKQKVLSLLDRSTGRARSRVIDSVKLKEILPILKENIKYEAHMMTDDAKQYYSLLAHFKKHDVVNHSNGEYVNAQNPKIHTNTVEGYFSIFKRGMKGVYQHCMKHHLHRYLAEFDFRYNHRIKNGYSDVERAEILLKGVVGKRLMYQTTNW
jgi:transposase-like protein